LRPVSFKPEPEFGAEIIQMCVQEQETFFRFFGLAPVTLFGRRLSAIDCQNLFCETDKFSRKAHPEFNLKRSKIKRRFKPRAADPPPVRSFRPSGGGFKRNRIERKLNALASSRRQTRPSPSRKSRRGAHFWKPALGDLRLDERKKRSFLSSEGRPPSKLSSPVPKTRGSPPH
jgi:hypothetical protein